MEFLARFSGDLVLTDGRTRVVRPVRIGKSVSLSARTAETYSESLRALIQASRMLPQDTEARAFAAGMTVEQFEAEGKAQ